jgi:hypothetical protein
MSRDIPVGIVTGNGMDVRGSNTGKNNIFMPITVAARPKARTTFARWNSGIVVSNPTWGIL